MRKSVILVPVVLSVLAFEAEGFTPTVDRRLSAENVQVLDLLPNGVDRRENPSILGDPLHGALSVDEENVTRMFASNTQDAGTTKSSDTEEIQGSMDVSFVDDSETTESALKERYSSTWMGTVPEGASATNRYSVADGEPLSTAYGSSVGNHSQTINSTLLDRNLGAEVDSSRDTTDRLLSEDDVSAFRIIDVLNVSETVHVPSRKERLTVAASGAFSSPTSFKNKKIKPTDATGTLLLALTLLILIFVAFLFAPFRTKPTRKQFSMKSNVVPVSTSHSTSLNKLQIRALDESEFGSTRKTVGEKDLDTDNRSSSSEATRLNRPLQVRCEATVHAEGNPATDVKSGDGLDENKRLEVIRKRADVGEKDEFVDEW